VITDTAPTATSPVTADHPALGSSRRETAAERRARPCFHDIAVSAADKHGVCARPLVMRTVDLDTGDSDYVAVACKSTMESQCPSCAKKARALRMQQLRDGWHLDHEPVQEPNPPTEVQTELLAHRADLVIAYRSAYEEGNRAKVEELREDIQSADNELRASGMRGRVPSPDAPATVTRTRSTRRRQDAPDLPTRQVRTTTVGREYAGKYRPSMFLTLTCDSYGPIRDGAPVDPNTYDYRRAARDAIHFSAQVDRVMQNLRRVLGWEVQYFATVEPQKRGAPHLHAAGRDSPPDHPPGRRRHLPPGVVAPPRSARLRQRSRSRLAGVGSGCSHVHRPAHPRSSHVVG
jgi:Helitron helicase-like domain at N-terminus